MTNKKAELIQTMISAVQNRSTMRLVKYVEDTKSLRGRIHAKLWMETRLQ